MGKKGCKFTVADEEEKEEEELQKPQLLVAVLNKILLSLIHSLQKRKEVDLLPESVKERAEVLSAANQARLGSEAPEVDDDDSMLPLSIVLSESSSSCLFYPTKDFAVHHL